jgi:predicted ATPase
MPKPKIADHFVTRVALRRDAIPSFGSYPFNIDAVRHLNILPLHPSVTFFVGENGSGKSTLLEAMAVAWGFNAEGGTQNFRFSTRASHSSLHDYLVLSKGIRRPKTGFFLRAESFYNVATEVEQLEVTHAYGGTSLHHQSHGESFMALMLHRFTEKGLYLLDEPEAALSPARQFAMLARLHELVKQGSQFIIATHSPILMAYPDALLYTFGSHGIIPTPFEETDHFTLTKMFLNNYPSMLAKLLP